MYSGIKHQHLPRSSPQACKWCGQPTTLLYDMRNGLTRNMPFERFAKPFCNSQCWNSYNG